MSRNIKQTLTQKIFTKDELVSQTKIWKAEGKKIVFTNGCFDIVHPGHVDYLCQARDLGDYLILGLNTDASVRQLEKAPGRPYNDESTRAAVLAGMGAVDAIVLFDEETPY